MYALISQLILVCKMQLNVLDDLAEAMKALDGKKDMILGDGVGAYLWGLRKFCLLREGFEKVKGFPSDLFAGGRTVQVMEEPSGSCRQNSIGRWEDRGPPAWELQIINLQDEDFVYSRC